MKRIRPYPRSRRWSPILLILALTCLAAVDAHAYRVVVYWTGAPAGTMVIQANGVGSGYVEVPEEACGFRLSHDPNPLLWSEAWFFADNSSLGQYAALNSSESWGPAAFIRATGPVNGNCGEENFSFHTPATLTYAGMPAPNGTGAFVAEFYHPDQIEWLDEAGIPIDPDIPEPPEPQDPTGPAFDWTIPPNLMSCVKDWKNHWHCGNDDGSSAAIMSLAFAVGRYAEQAAFAVERAHTADNARERSRHAGQAVATLDAIVETVDELARLVVRLEGIVQRESKRPQTISGMNSIAATVGMVQVNLAACRAEAVGEQRVVLRTRSEGREPTLAPHACASAAGNAFDIVAEVLQLRTFETPAELR